MPETPSFSEPHAHGTTFRGCIDAALDLWGKEGLAAIAARVTPETRRVMLEEPLLAIEWHPVRLLVDWCHAVWDGPAMRQESAFDLYVDRQIDLGLSRIHRIFMKVMTPGTLAERAAKIWRREHSHGQVTVSLGQRTATVVFREHPYLESPLMVRLMAESIRYMGTLTRVGRVRESHRLDAGALHVDLSWE